MAAPGETYCLALPSNINPKLYISMGIPFAKSCAYHVTNTFHASKVYIIVSSSISKTENFSFLQTALGDRIAGTKIGIKPHSPWTDILEIVQDINKTGSDLIVTLGAGSLTDGAKVITFALANSVSTLDELAKLTTNANTPNLQPCQIPIINIPTSLSGGEYSLNGGATDMRTHRKSSFNHPSMGSSLIILDPALSVSTPMSIWISTGMRAVDHCVEGLCSTAKKSVDADVAYERGLGLLLPNLLTTIKDQSNLEARLNEMLGVREAMRGTKTGVPMGASHGIGHQLGPLGVGHGETSCVMLPPVLKYNFLHGDEAVRKLQQKVVEIFWSIEPVAAVLKERGLDERADAGDIVGAFVSELGMPRTLKDVGVGREKLDGLADNAMKDRWIPTNPVPLKDRTQLLDILEMATGY